MTGEPITRRYENIQLMTFGQISTKYVFCVGPMMSRKWSWHGKVIFNKFCSKFLHPWKTLLRHDNCGIMDEKELFV